MALLKTQHCLSTTHQSVEILANLEAHPAFKKAKIVLLYHSLEDEVNTHKFIEKWSLHKQIILPVVVGNNLELRPYTGDSGLKIGAFGIEEPTGMIFKDYEAIDLVVVPGVAFDHAGNRLGRGKGYYDRLLSHIPAFKIGICFPFQFIENVPSEPLDIRMDTIITTK